MLPKKKGDSLVLGRVDRYFSNTLFVLESHMLNTNFASELSLFSFEILEFILMRLIVKL